MIIEVNKNYRITSNPTCWQVEKRKSDRKDGTERWEPLTYHVDFKNALVSLVEYRIRTIEDNACVDEIKSTLKEIKAEVISSVEVFTDLPG
jgi:hypothetical protein